MLRQRIHFSDKAILSPKWDLFCIGGLSIGVMGGIIIYLFALNLSGDYIKGQVNFIDLIVLQALINWPHFTASYKQLYSHKANIFRYPTASLTVPALLMICCIAGLLMADADKHAFSVNERIAYYFWMFSAFYLAWHYTGQTWGMIAVFSRLSGLKLKKKEVKVLKLGLKSLILWHVVWGIQGLPALPGLSLIQSDWLMTLANSLALISFVAGLVVYYQILKRSAKLDPRVFIPWLAAYVWYFVLFLEPGAYIYVQLSHALQYLIFPIRIEMNKRKAQSSGQVYKSRLILHFVLYYSVLVASGLLIFYVPDVLIGAPQNVMTIGGMLAIAVNIHHYYVDSVIWKLRKGPVKGELFRHLTDKGRERRVSV